jgi:Kdo2-lipid IVA lauroyltransferase/acyltransferase
MWFFLLISRLPWWFMYALSDMLYFLVTRVYKYRRKVVIFNLKLAFPEKSETEINAIASGFYRNLCDVIVEILKTATLSREQMQQHVVVENDQEMLEILGRGQSVLVLCNHLGNWEWLLLGQGAGSQYTMPIDAVYKPLHNKFFDNFIFKLRTRFGGNLIPDQKILRKLVSDRAAGNGGHLVAIMADQAPPPVGAFKIPFFNTETNFFAGPDKLAKATQFPVFFEAMHRIGRGKYRIEIRHVASPPHGPDSTIIETYAQWLEEAVRKSPSDWLWSHKRWKHTVPMP